jgi:ribosomal protein S21
MTVEVKRKSGESVESLLRRFTEKIQHSGVLYRAKITRFRQSPKSKRQIREEARRRQMMRAKREYLARIGKLDESEDLQGAYRKKYGLRKTLNKK